MNGSTPATRLTNHRSYVIEITERIQSLMVFAAEAALRVHNEIEELHARIEALENMHPDPAAHGRGLPQHGRGSHPNLDVDG